MNRLVNDTLIIALLFIAAVGNLESASEPTYKQAAALRHSAPEQALNILEKLNSNAVNKNDEQVFEQQLLALNINQKLGRDKAANLALERIRAQLDDKQQFASWIAVLKSTVFLSNQDLDAAKNALTGFEILEDAYSPRRLRVWYKYALARLDTQNNQYESALTLLNEIIPESKHTDSVTVTAGSLALLVNIQYYRGEYQKAIESNDLLLELASVTQDSFYQVFALSNAMNTYYMMNLSLNPSIEQAKTEKEKESLRANQAAYLKKSDNLKTQTLELSQRIRAFKIELRALVMSQNQHLSRDENQRAVSVGLQGIKLAEQYGVVYEKAVLLNNLAIAYRVIDEHHKGIEALQQAEEIYTSLKSEQSLLWILEDYSIAYEIVDDYEKALDYYQQYHQASLELTQKTNSKKVIELQEIFEHEKNLNEIERLNQKDIISQNQINAQQTQNLIYLLFGVILLVIIYSVYNRNRIISLKNNALDELNQKLREQALRDPLTGLYNRRLINEIKEKISNACIRKFSDHPENNLRMGIVLLDIDHFKRINDNFGHSVGDAVIQQISNELTENLRDGDIAIRWGGEEFLIIMFDTIESGVRIFCERYLEQRNQNKIMALGHELAVTVSIGYSLYPFSTAVPKFMGWEDTIKLIDNYLYTAKHQGRNCAVSSSAKDSDLDQTLKTFLLDYFEDEDNPAYKKVSYNISFPGDTSSS
jgi:diguanylate cyclase (GGDEF)-like protein